MHKTDVDQRPHSSLVSSINSRRLNTTPAQQTGYGTFDWLYLPFLKFAEKKYFVTQSIDSSYISISAFVSVLFLALLLAADSATFSVGD